MFFRAYLCFALRRPADGKRQQYDTEQDAWYSGIWINTARVETFTYAEGDTIRTIAPDIETFCAELARLNAFHPQAPTFVCIDVGAGSITYDYDSKPEV